MGVGGGVVSDTAAAQGAVGSPYWEEDWYAVVNKRGKLIQNKVDKKAARLSLSWRIDRNYDAVGE